MNKKKVSESNSMNMQKLMKAAAIAKSMENKLNNSKTQNAVSSILLERHQVSKNTFVKEGSDDIASVPKEGLDTPKPELLKFE